MKKALIFYGGWDGHDPIRLSELFENMLKEEGFTVTRTDTMDILDNAGELKTYDLILPVWTMGEIKQQRCQNICDAVAAGVGLAGCHGGMCDAFRDNTDWQFMTGAQWVAHPGGDGVEYMVRPSSESPLVHGLSEFRVVSEQYYLHVDPAVRVHAVTRFPVVDGPHMANGPVDMPVVFTKQWGKGRVYYNALGHQADVFDLPQAREMMRRGMLWAAGEGEK